MKLQASTGGRRARTFKINEMYKLVMGMAVKTEAGIESIQLTIADWEGNTIYYKSLVFERIDYSTISNLVQEYLDKYFNIRSIGIGIPGVATDGTIGICDIKQLENCRVKEKLETQFENIHMTH